MSKLTLSILQMEALGLARAEEALERALSRIDEAGKHQPDLIVLPECTYPAYYLHSLEQYRAASVRPHQEVVRLFGERARRHRCHLIVGLAEPTPTGRLRNAAYLLGPSGEVIGDYAKSFLWHFDQCWFDPEDRYPTFDLPFGRTGLLICADGRMPEIARCMAVDGARLLIDPTAWVSSGGDRATLTNPQYEYMIRTRALENGTWIVVANKVGVEADSILYCGRSCLVSPDGEIHAVASTYQEELLVAEIDVALAQGPALSRRPDCYAVLGRPTSDLPATRSLDAPLVPQQSAVRVGTLQLRPYDNTGDYLERVRHLCETLVRQDTSLIVLPGIPRVSNSQAIHRADQLLHPLLDLSDALQCALAFSLIEELADGRYHSAYLVDRGAVLGCYRRSHVESSTGEEITPGNTLPVFDSPYGRVGFLLDEEGLLPEVARSLMLQGAELLIWLTPALPAPLRMVARSRADENKVFVLLASPVEPGLPVHSAIIPPNGSFLAAALPDIEQALSAQVLRSQTRNKEMAPNTNVIHGRMPTAYAPLLLVPGR